MKKLFGILAACLLWATPMFAQLRPTIPIAELFVGGSFYRAGISTGTNLVGWNTDLDYNLSKHVGVVLDFGGQYKRTTGITIANYQYMIGPQFKKRAGRLTLFAHGLVGGDAIHVPNATQGGFSAGFGGGVDFSAGRLVSIRVLQVDSIHDHFSGVWGNNLRASVGVVFKFPRP
jgi:hypothetical protein